MELLHSAVFYIMRGWLQVGLSFRFLLTESRKDFAQIPPKWHLVFLVLHSVLSQAPLGGAHFLLCSALALALALKSNLRLTRLINDFKLGAKFEE